MIELLQPSVLGVEKKKTIVWVVYSIEAGEVNSVVLVRQKWARTAVQTKEQVVVWERFGKIVKTKD